MKPDVIFWIFLGIFAITAIITLLGITNVIKGIKDKYLTALFTSLILEVIGGMVVLFNSFDYSETKYIPASIYSETTVDSSDNVENDIRQIIELIHAGEEHNNNKDRIAEEVADLNQQLDKYEEDFYSRIIELDALRFKYKKSINMRHGIEEKELVFGLLHEIFMGLDRLDESNNAPDVVAKEWIEFKKQFSNKHLHIILGNDIPFPVGEYLEKYHNFHVGGHEEGYPDT